MSTCLLFSLFRALDKEGHCIEAVRMIILCQLCQEGQYTEAAAQLGDLIQLVDRFEPKNHRLYYDLSQCFCRVVGYVAVKCGGGV